MSGSIMLRTHVAIRSKPRVGRTYLPTNSTYAGRSSFLSKVYCSDSRDNHGASDKSKSGETSRANTMDKSSLPQTTSASPTLARSSAIQQRAQPFSRPSPHQPILPSMVFMLHFDMLGSILTHITLHHHYLHHHLPDAPPRISYSLFVAPRRPPLRAVPNHRLEGTEVTLRTPLREGARATTPPAAALPAMGPKKPPPATSAA